MLQSQPVCLMIADISGYTKYLAGVELDHAQDILADLINTIVTALGPNFQLAKLEGDAAFMYSPTETIDGSHLLDAIERCYFGFRRRRRDVQQATSCECDACVRIPTLDLKFVVHRGVTIIQQVAGHQELLGSDVIIVHRLLKNDVVEKLQMPAYAMISQACMDATDLDPAALGMIRHTETYESVGDIACWVQDLERRWSEEDARQRVIVTPDDAMFMLSVDVKVPPQVAWEFLTKPGQRMSWQPWVTEVEVKGATGGRRGVGSANHCMHGPDTTIEEILDWRPYDYVTDRTIVETPHGLLKLLHTIELEPTAAGTEIRFRFARPDDPEQAELAGHVGDAYADAMRSTLPTLAQQMEDGFAAR